MLKIGEFSRLSMVTIKALRFYDEEDLLKPVHVDEFTGYRYYDNEQLYDLQMIISLRQAGLSIKEIKCVISGNDSLEILEKKKMDMEREKHMIDDRLKRIAKLINGIKENKPMKFQAMIKEISAYEMMYGAKTLKSFSDITDFVTGLGQECAKANPDIKCIKPDYCFMTYLDEEFKEHDFTAMYSQAVEKRGVDSENVKFKSLPAVTAVSVLVRGEYNENLPLGYAFAIRWTKEQGYEIIDKPREVYIDGIWNKNNSNDWLTEIQIPIRKI